MKKIQLTLGKCALVDDEDFAQLSKFKWCAYRSRSRREVYYAGRGTYFNRKVSLRVMHRDILDLTDSKIHVDHIDGDGLNNQRRNLRLSNPLLNSHNTWSRIDSSSTFVGVSWCKRTHKWQSQLRVNMKNLHFGRFDTEIHAAEVRDAFAYFIFGEHARLNFQNDHPE